MKHLDHNPARNGPGQTDTPATADTPLDAMLDRHPLSPSPMAGAGGGQSRPAPGLRLDATAGPKDKWHGNDARERTLGEHDPAAEAYRAWMLAKVGGDMDRTIDFTDEELAALVHHAEGKGFEREDIEAVLTVKVRKPWVRLKNMTEVVDCLDKKQDMVIEQEDGEETSIFRDGWYFMRAYREAQALMLDGGVLDPANYLTEEFMGMHKAAFTDFASYLITGKAYEKFIVDKDGDYPNLGYMGALYISTFDEIDRVIADSAGDVAEIERLLGITGGSWQGKGGLWRVDLIKPEEHMLRIPTGAEASANEFWTPGGFTSGGTMEAVINPVPKQKGVTYNAEQVVFENNEMAKLIA